MLVASEARKCRPCGPHYYYYKSQEGKIERNVPYCESTSRERERERERERGAKITLDMQASY